ncbi:MAG TPA: NAD(P)/FAD-dependent oxidoreductase [Solirubrobacteraceae bacterium]|jgi:2-polyprenyl-6-methoxyphenol hydroxylase-like FAD-dependent oxidoreductase
MDEYDVAIVGASIAGCAAATMLGRQGAKVALIESHSDPNAFKSLCTHALQPSATPVLERLGLVDSIVAAGGEPGDSYTWTRYGWFTYSDEDASSPFSGRSGWNVRREKLDPMVRDLAVHTDGVESMLGWTVTSLLRSGERVSGVVARGHDGREREIRAKAVVGADGRNSRVAKLAGVRTKVSENKRFIYFAYYRDTPLVTGSDPQVWLLDPDVAYGFPTDAGLTLLACMIPKERLEEFKGDPESAMQRVFAGLADGPRLDPAKRESKVMGSLDVPNLLRGPTAAGLALVGDAAMACDPLPGVGCGFAFQSAAWLSDELGPALKGDAREVDSALSAYASRHREGLRLHGKLISMYSRGGRFTPLLKLLYRGAARDQQLANRAMLVAGRWITPLEMFKEGTFRRLLWVNMRRRLSPLGLVERRTPTPKPVRDTVASDAGAQVVRS